jgi:hypothetical protein
MHARHSIISPAVVVGGLLERSETRGACNQLGPVDSELQMLPHKRRDS